jgi:hypothetical protein
VLAMYSIDLNSIASERRILSSDCEAVHVYDFGLGIICICFFAGFKINGKRFA